jgi:hypothetical protein
MTSTPPTSPTYPPTSAPAPAVGWIRRHKVITSVVGVIVGLMILGGISNALQSHKTNSLPTTNTSSSSGSTQPSYTSTTPSYGGSTQSSDPYGGSGQTGSAPYDPTDNGPTYTYYGGSGNTGIAAADPADNGPAYAYTGGSGNTGTAAADPSDNGY